MVPFPARRADDLEHFEPDTSPHGRIQPEIQELATRLAAQGIQSTELVLDLVLHDLADEARQVTGATGAAIALEREGELVCRAAAGTTAPDLGVRIHTESGLSGTCVKEGTTQICSDTDADERVDAEACRRLSVRSIVVVPLFSAAGIIGIFEAFSVRPHAFSADDVGKLESLAAIAAQTVKGTREKAFDAEQASGITDSDSSREASPAPSVASIMQKVTPVDPAVKVLRWLLIALAIPLVVLIGFDWGWHRAKGPLRPISAPRAKTAAASPLDGENSRPPAAPHRPPPAVTPKNTAAKPKNPNELAHRGGLVIYQNGRVIYRELPPVQAKEPNRAKTASEADSLGIQPATTGTGSSSEAETASANSLDSPPALLPAGVTGGRLLHSVRPKYPSGAITHKLEGPVVLRGTVGKDGVIHDLTQVRGDPALSQAAVEAVQQWKYEPYRMHGEPIPMPIDITVDFTLPK
ncbi:MAG: TonB family protein [Acidobacteria bacterium]|nr:TonB family protein [Acidobacteriota bacterium]